jgi:small subunit ribosomal protein S14
MSTAAQEAKAKKLMRKYKKGTLEHESKLFRRGALTGRTRGFIRHFGICRNKFRELANKGLIPGVKRSSW